MPPADSARIASQQRIALFVALFFLQSASLASENLTKLRFGILETAFHGVAPSSAKASLENVLNRNTANHFDAKVITFPNHESFSTAVRTQNIDMFLLPSLDYLSLEKYATPVLGTIHYGDSPLTKLVVLTRKDNPIRFLAELKGAEVILQKGVDYDLLKFWLEHITRRTGASNAEMFFGPMSESFRTSEVVLPVFFGRAEACVIAMENWIAMADLNPQIAEQLQVVEESDELIGTVIAFHSEFQAAGMNDFVNHLTNFHKTKDGQHLLTLAKTKQLVTYQPEWINGVRALNEAHSRQIEKQTQGDQK